MKTDFKTLYDEVIEELRKDIKPSVPDDPYANILKLVQDVSVYLST